ncbi:efflux RND transporter periplasmic adaptor subunit [Rhizobium sp. YIM 134829]|uniref:efflux RND transporter periplasmic adaptor subunit n=1 Tax=Rhizobium sp. YIM 134829 TaxID=3390453 RepID=UPI00397E55DF
MAVFRTYAPGAFIALSLLAGVALAEEQKAAAPAEPLLPSIVVTKATRTPVVDRVVATGTIQAVEETYVAPLVDGLSIQSLAVDIGDRVQAGQVLAVLNSDALVLQKSQNEASLAKAKAALSQNEAQLIEAQANAEEAERVAQRNARLKETGSVSTALADQTESAAAVARARVRSAEQLIDVAKADIQVSEAQISDVDLRLARTEVKAPVAGTISAKTAKVGAIANGNDDPLFTIIRDSALEMRADVTEADLLKIAVGQKVALRLTDSREVLEGTVRLISPMVDSQTRLGTVYLSIAKPERARIGMYATADIIVAAREGLALPLTAVTSGREGTTVRKVENGIVQMVKVTTGIQDGSKIEILSGLSEGEAVVAKAGAYVRDGDHIKPVDAVASAAPSTN